MKHVARIPYKEVEFFFISSHYDLHIKGLCIYNNKISHFQTDLDTLYKDEPEDDEPDTLWDTRTQVDIYELTNMELSDRLMEKTKFEIMVGYHWSYPEKALGHQFYIRKPKWFFKFLFWLFYKLKK